MGVYKRKGKWEIRFTIRGKPYYRQVPEAQSKAEAQVAEATMRREVFEGRYGKEGGASTTADFVTFCREQFLPAALARVKHAQFISYSAGLLCRHFQGRTFAEITPLVVEQFRRRMLAQKSMRGKLYKPVTVRIYIALLSRIFEAAIDEGVATANPCRKIKWKRGETTSRRERVLTSEEEVKLFEQLEVFPEARDAARIALNTGLRKMTILKMHVSQFDVSARTFRFMGKGGGEHVLPLNSEAWAVVERRLTDLAPGGYLFRKRTGYILSHGQASFRLAVSRAGLHDLHFHDLRHTFATRLRGHTGDPYTVRDAMTHASLKMTDIYANRDLASVREAVEGLARARPALKMVKSA